MAVGLQLKLTTATADCNKDHLYAEYHIDTVTGAYKDNALMIDLRLPDLGTRRAIGIYVASIIRTRSSLPTFITSISPYQPMRS